MNFIMFLNLFINKTIQLLYLFKILTSCHILTPSHYEFNLNCTANLKWLLKPGISPLINEFLYGLYTTHMVSYYPLKINHFSIVSHWKAAWFKLNFSFPGAECFVIPDLLLETASKFSRSGVTRSRKVFFATEMTPL